MILNYNKVLSNNIMKYTVVENNIAGYINNMGGGGSCTIHVWIGVFVALQGVTNNHA